MSNFDNSPPVGPIAGQTTTVSRAGTPDPREMGWPAMVPAYDAAGTSGLKLWHGFRRRWFLGITLGLLGAAIAGPATWHLYGAWYEAAGFLRVQQVTPAVVFATADAARDPVNEFEVYKSTQQQLLKSRLVLTRALARPEVRQFDLDNRARDPVAWLEDALTVRFPGKAEIMEVALRSRSPKEAQMLVQAVVDSYLNDVVNGDRTRRVSRLNQLDKAYGEKENDVRTALSNLKRLAEQFGTSDKETLSLKQQIAMQQYADYQRELIRVQFDLRRTRGELDAQTALLENVDEAEIPEIEVEREMSANVAYRMIAEEASMQKQNRAITQALPLPGTQQIGVVTRYRADGENMRGPLDASKRTVREGLRELRRADIEKERQKKEMEFAVLQQHERELAKEVEKRSADADRLSSAPIELEMMRSELEHSETVLKSIAEEREKLRVELNSQPRISSLGNVEEPKAEYLPAIRTGLTILCMLGAFLMPLGLVTWLESHTQKVSSDNEVTAIGLPLLGTLPKNRKQLVEAADCISARLLRNTSPEQCKVILVTSADAREGKTTVATNLAASLAHCGRNTVLVDFNLRKSAGKAGDPGVGNLLRGEGDLSGMIVPTSVENLFHLPAGDWDPDADQRTLAQQDVGARIFESLRTQDLGGKTANFVIVDGSAVLPTADTRLISPFADLVILSVRKDFSRLPRVRSAQEILDAFRVQQLEVVFVGSHERMS